MITTSSTNFIMSKYISPVVVHYNLKTTSCMHLIKENNMDSEHVLLQCLWPPMWQVFDSNILSIVNRDALWMVHDLEGTQANLADIDLARDITIFDLPGVDKELIRDMNDQH